MTSLVINNGILEEVKEFTCLESKINKFEKYKGNQSEDHPSKRTQSI